MLKKETRCLDAATYYHQAEFYLPAGDARNYAAGMKNVAGYESGI
jgi:hypothetical protein